MYLQIIVNGKLATVIPKDMLTEHREMVEQMIGKTILYEAFRCNGFRDVTEGHLTRLTVDLQAAK